MSYADTDKNEARLVWIMVLLAVIGLIGFAACDGSAMGDDDGPGGGPHGDDDSFADAGRPADAAPPVSTVTVCASGGDHATIAAAIAAIPEGAAIEVCPGTYHERLTIDGKSLHLIGTGGQAATVIDGDAAGTVLTIKNVGGDGVSVKGITFKNGKTTGPGGGINCADSTLHLVDSAVAASTAKTGGGGLYANGCALDVHGTRLTGNQGTKQGGGAWLRNASGTLEGNIIDLNKGEYGGGIAISEGTLALVGNTIKGNDALTRGGGLYHESNGLVDANQIIENHSGWTGGGVHVITHAPLFRANNISNNKSENDGGGLYVHQSMITLEKNHVAGNSGGDDGGGIRIFESPAYLVENLVENNTTADSGAGIRISHVQSTLVDNVVRKNTATGTGGGLDLDNDSTIVRGGEISGNRASTGAGIFMWRAPWNGALIENVKILDNHAWHGGGIALDDNFQPVTLRNLTLSGNDADRGGALYVRATNLTFTHSVIRNNEANDMGGGLYIGANGHWHEMCPCPPTMPKAKIEFLTIYDNEAPNGAGVFVSFPDLTVQNVILSNNVGTQVTVAGSEDEPFNVPKPVWRYNDTFPASFAGMANPTGQNGNLASDPMLMNPAAGNVHLQTGSPCIDAGDPAMQDTNGTRADMGYFGGSP